jgi:hypothetical protein
VKAFIAPPVLMPKNPLYNNPQVTWYDDASIVCTCSKLTLSLSRFSMMHITQAKECVDSFFFYNEHTFVMFLEICGFNRARQRDKIARLLDNFASLQDEVGLK